ncbi:hypothetical protein TKK_0004690 [Trichogramma kaykai]
MEQNCELWAWLQNINDERRKIDSGEKCFENPFEKIIKFFKFGDDRKESGTIKRTKVTLAVTNENREIKDGHYTLRINSYLTL